MTVGVTHAESAVDRLDSHRVAADGVDRAFVERNAIALLSNFERSAVDPRVDDWLGRHSRSRKIRESGLWNVDHADEPYDPAVLDRLERAVEGTTPP